MQGSINSECKARLLNTDMLRPHHEGRSGCKLRPRRNRWRAMRRSGGVRRITPSMMAASLSIMVHFSAALITPAECRHSALMTMSRADAASSIGNMRAKSNSRILLYQSNAPKRHRSRNFLARPEGAIPIPVVSSHEPEVMEESDDFVSTGTERQSLVPNFPKFDPRPVRHGRGRMDDCWCAGT